MNEITFLRFECDAGHITTIKHNEMDNAVVQLDHCSVCGSIETRKVESETIRADALETDMNAVSYKKLSF